MACKQNTPHSKEHAVSSDRLHMQLRQHVFHASKLHASPCSLLGPCSTYMQVMLCTCECACTRWGMMETPGAMGSSSVMDSGVWQEALQRHPPPLTIRPPSIMESGATCRVPASVLHVVAFTVGRTGSLLGLDHLLHQPWMSASSVRVGSVSRASGVLVHGENHTHVLMSAAWHSCILPCHQFGM